MFETRQSIRDAAPRNYTRAISPPAPSNQHTGLVDTETAADLTTEELSLRIES